MSCRDGGSLVILILTPVVLVAILPLDILRLLFVVEYATPDLLTDLGVAELKMGYLIVGRIGVRLSSGCSTCIE